MPIGIHLLDVFFEDAAHMELEESEALAEIMIGVHRHNFIDPKIEDDLMKEILNEYRIFLNKTGEKE